MMMMMLTTMITYNNNDNNDDDYLLESNNIQCHYDATPLDDDYHNPWSYIISFWQPKRYYSHCERPLKFGNLRMKRQFQASYESSQSKASSLFVL